jgi:hypothetical protein
VRLNEEQSPDPGAPKSRKWETIGSPLSIYRAIKLVVVLWLFFACLKWVQFHVLTPHSKSDEKAVAPADENKSVSGSLKLFSPTIDRATRRVMVNGADSARPSIPFEFDWGDGTTTTGFFPQEKIYGGDRGNYMIRVTATHSDGSKPVASIAVDLR